MFRKSGFLLLLLLPAAALAHAGQQGLILLLPTDIYIAAGGFAVLATVAVAAGLNHAQFNRVFTPKPVPRSPAPPPTLISLGSTVLLAALVWLGLFGPHDPLANLLSLSIWTVLWIGLVVICGLFGNLWVWLNPWSGLYTLLFGAKPEPPLTLPNRLNYWPAILGFVAFNAYGIANPAATDPIQLGILTSLYWMFTFVMMMLFGPTWLRTGEFISVFIALLASIAPLRRGPPTAIGTPGWQITQGPPPSFALALFAIVLLGTGTFDGFNETFFWLTQLGINPLAFPGRSAIVTQTVLGLIAANVLLPLLFYLCIHPTTPPQHRAEMFRRQALTILPIALAYHFSHFLPSFMVDIQYTVKALSDPLRQGADYLGLGQFYVTTGFFNTLATQRAIFLTQAGAIVAGHILAILLSHRIACDYFSTRRAVLTSQLPLSLFMIGYTVLGLWLLATPKGA